MADPRVLILSPHSDEIARLQDALVRAGFPRRGEELTGDVGRQELEGLSTQDDPVRAVLVDLGRGPQGYSILRAARRALPGAVAVGSGGPRRLSAVVQARQAGAWGYVTAPYDLSPLAERLGLSDRERPAEQDGSLIAFLPAQGGAGASTVCLHVASALARRLDGDVLLIDFDFHTGTVGFQLGLEDGAGLGSVLADQNLTRAAVEQAASPWRKLDVLTSPLDPSAIDRDALARTAETLARLKQLYRVIVVDLPTPLLTASVETLSVSDVCFLVCTPEITSLHLAKRKVDQFHARGLSADTLRLLVNRTGTLGGLDNGHIERIVGAKVEWAIDNDYAAVRKAAWEGGLVAPDTALAQQTEHLSAEIAESMRLAPATEEPAKAVGN